MDNNTRTKSALIDGAEYLDQTPIATPVGFTTRPLSLQDRLAQFDPRTRQNLYRSHFGEDEDMDFDDDEFFDDDEPSSPAELRHYEDKIYAKAPKEPSASVPTTPAAPVADTTED